MTDYKNFDVEDFIQDDFFIAWVLHPTKTEIEFWQQWQIDHPEKKVYLAQARSILLAITVQPIAQEVSPADVEDVMGYVKAQGYLLEDEEHKPARPLFTSWLKVAAVLFAVLAASLFFYVQFYQPKNNQGDAMAVQWIDFKNKTGQSRIIRMADGSLAVLKPNSVLKYPSAFTDTTRDVFLEGEAFFEVHKDAAKAFLVHSENMVTKVLGTSFTVRAFAKERNFKVIVNTGKVMVYTRQNAVKEKPHAVLLLPHQQVVLKRQQAELVKDTVTATLLLAKETAQKEFSFYKASIPTVVERLEAAYHVEIAYNRQQFENVTVTAALSDLPLDEKVKLLCKAVGATCSFNDGQITIYKN